MKYIFTLLGVLILTTVCFATDYQFRDSKIFFLVATVNNRPAYTQAEKTALTDEFNLQVSSGYSLDIVNYTPTSNEVALSTCLVSIEGGWYFKNYLTNKNELENKVMEAKTKRDTFINGSLRYKDFNDRYSWLLSYYSQLP